MLDDLDASLKALLVGQLPVINEQLALAESDVLFDAPTREFNSKRGGRATLSLYLYNVQENRHLRGRAWDRRFEDGAFSDYRPDVKLDCSYIVTAWANEVEDEHKLLAGAARVFFRHPQLPPEILQGSLLSIGPITTEVAQPESFKDAIDIWSVLDGDLKPSLRVTVTVPLDLNVPKPPAESSPPVTQPPRIDVSTVQAEALQGGATITGRVVKGGEPVVCAVVRVGHSTAVTDHDGRYTLRDVPRPTTQALMDDPDEAGKVAVLVAADRQLYMREQDLIKDATIEIGEGDTASSGGAEAGTQEGRSRPTKKKDT